MYIRRLESLNQLIHQRWFVLLWLVVLVSIVRLPGLQNFYDNDSAANSYHARLILQGEPLYSTHHPGHHLPGIYYTYALIYLILGKSALAVKLILILWTVLTAYIVYRIGLLMSGSGAGIMAASFYAVLTGHIYLYGTTAETELFGNLPMILAIWLCIVGIVNRKKVWPFFLSGIFMAIAFLYKATYITSFLVAILLLTITALWQKNWRVQIIRLYWSGIGLIGVFLLAITYYVSTGLLDRFLMVFHLGARYVSGSSSFLSLIATFLGPLKLIASNNLLLSIMSLAGLYFMARQIILIIAGRFINRNKRESKQGILMPGWIASICVMLWFVVSLFIADVNQKIILPHYGLPIVPSLSLLAAWELNRLYQQVKTQSPRKAFGILSVAIIMIGSISFIGNYRMIQHFVLYTMKAESYESFLMSGAPFGYEYLSAKKLADYIKPRTSPDDYVYYWSDIMQFYELVDRRAPIENTWPIYVDALGPYQRIFVPRTIYVIVGESILREKTPWLEEELAKAYRLETVIDGQEVYRRIDQSLIPIPTLLSDYKKSKLLWVIKS